MSENDCISFGKRLKAVRTSRGMTQEQTAAQMNYSIYTYAGWEQGISEPKATQIEELCGLFCCSPEDLLGKRGGNG